MTLTLQDKAFYSVTIFVLGLCILGLIFALFGMEYKFIAYIALYFVGFQGGMLVMKIIRTYYE